MAADVSGIQMEPHTMTSLTSNANLRKYSTYFSRRLKVKQSARIVANGQIISVP